MKRSLVVAALLSLGCGSGGPAEFVVSRSWGPAPLWVDAASIAPPETIASYAWDFGDGSAGSGRAVSRTYERAGRYRLKLTVTDAAGTRTSSERTILVGRAGTPLQPLQPEIGPGGSDYAHAAVRQSTYGTGRDAYHLFEPAAPRPEGRVPVVVFLHGWSGVPPRLHEGWIRHIVRKGAIVIFPVYQQPGDPPGMDRAYSAIGAIQRALAELETGDHVRPDTSRAAMAGHSYGGMLTAAIASVAAENGLPLFRAIMCNQPGGPLEPRPDLSKIPAGTLLLTTASDRDRIVGTTNAEAIHAEATSVAPADKDYIFMRSDEYGEPDLVVGHGATLTLAPGARGDAISWYGFWKWFDALCDAAFYAGKNRAFALGDTPEQRHMGRWSDGTPVVEPVVTD